MEKINLKIKHIIRTCPACPSQWEGTLNDGRMIYIRYRWGYLSVSVSPESTVDVMDAVAVDEVWGKQTGDGLDGCIGLEAVLEKTGLSMVEE